MRNAHRYLSNAPIAWIIPGHYDSTCPLAWAWIESGHRHVLQARLKKAGAAWLHKHADAIGHLRVVRANHNWESLWN